MRLGVTVSAIVAGMCVAVAGGGKSLAAASSGSAFNRAYVGSVEGRQTGSGQTITWTIRHLVLRKMRVGRDGELSTASYVARAGRVTVDFRHTPLEGCTWVPVHESFRIAGLDRSTPHDAVVSHDTALRVWDFQAKLWRNKARFTTTISCPDGLTQTDTIQMPPLLEGGQTGGGPGKRLRGRYRETSEVGVGTWSWRLRARR